MLHQEVAGNGAHDRQQSLVGPVALGHEVVQHLMGGLDTSRRDPSR